MNTSSIIAIMMTFRYTLTSCARFERCTVVNNLLNLSSFSKPRASSRSEKAVGVFSLAKELKGTLEIKSRKKEPFKYFLAIVCGSLTSMLCLVSRKLVRNLIMMSKRKKRSTKASMQVITLPLSAVWPFSLQKICTGMMIELYMARMMTKLFQYLTNSPLPSKIIFSRILG